MEGRWLGCAHLEHRRERLGVGAERVRLLLEVGGQVELERGRGLVHVDASDRVREQLAEGRLSELLGLRPRLRLKRLERHRAVDVGLQAGGELGGGGDLSLALLVPHVLERDVRGVHAPFGLLQHRRDLQLADEVFELRPEAIRSNQKQSEAIRSNQKPSETIRSHQKPSEAIRSYIRSYIRRNRKPSEAIGSHQKKSEAIGSHQTQSEACRRNQKPPDAIRSNHKK